jgi:release factor glutamine methyltransferase
MIYQPAEDSYLLEKEVKTYIKRLKSNNKKNKDLNNIKVLDMGSGSGIQAKAAIKLGINRNNVICADIAKEAVYYLRKQKLKAIKTNLFSNIKKNIKKSNKKENKFNLIIFNPPYLPKNQYDNNYDTTSGKTGNETIIKFLKQAKPYLKKQGSILLLFSSFSKPKIILKQAKKLKYKAKKLAEKNIFFEKLYVYEFSIKEQNGKKSRTNTK